MSDVLLRTTLAVKLVEFGRLIAMRHTQCIDPLCIRFLIQVSFIRITSQMSLHRISYQVLNVLNKHLS